MASGITYDGVESAEGGNIFEGLSFWVAQRVPTRHDILSKLKSNGGTVVPLEKDAKFLIADHARKDAPPGSYSWKFITDSVENGVLQVEDRYRIGPDPNQPRSVGSSTLTRAGRVAFSHADDAILAKWVLSRPALGRKGNDIYQQLEKLNPRHTWQSWRSRWTAKLQTRDDRELKMLAATAPDDAFSQEPAVLSTKASDSASATLEHPQPMPQRAPAAAPPQGGRTAFSAQDDAIIAQWALANSLTLGTNVFKELEQEHPHHSWESWRNRWNKKIRLCTLEDLERLAAAGTEETPSINEDQPTTSPPINHEHKGRSVKAERSGKLPVKGTSAASTPKKKITPAGSPASQNLDSNPLRSSAYHEKQKAQDIVDTKTKPHEAEKILPQQEQNAEEHQTSAVRGYEASVAEEGAEEEAEGAVEKGEGVSDEGDDPQRDQFYRDLISFNGCKLEDFEWPVLSGDDGDYEVDLFELAQAYDAQNASPEDVDWSKIAQELGWVPEEDTWVATALQTCFEERLMDFLEAMNEFDIEAPDAEVDEGDEEQDLVDATMPSSPPVRHESPKRRRESDPIASTASVRKRRRVKDAEVPSTPDEAVRVSRELREAHGISVSPLFRRDSTQASQQLPLLQRTPSRPRVREASSLRPLEVEEGLEGIGGRREEETSSDEEMPPLSVILNSRTTKASKRILPASFARTITPTQHDPQPTAQHDPHLPTEVHAEPPFETVSAWFSRHLRTGYPQHILDLALHHTTLTPGPSADHVVDSLANDNGIPIDLPGVWLPHEDHTVKQLMTTDLSTQASCALELIEQKRLREEQRRLIERHTWEGLSRRKKYLKKKMGTTPQGSGKKTSLPLLKSTGQTRTHVNKVEGEEKKRSVAPRRSDAKPALLTAEEKKRRELELRRMMMEEDEEEYY